MTTQVRKNVMDMFIDGAAVALLSPRPTCYQTW